MSNHFKSVQSYSEEALLGAIATLSKNPRRFHDASWEARRLLALRNEVDRRNRIRRGKDAA